MGRYMIVIKCPEGTEVTYTDDYEKHLRKRILIRCYIKVYEKQDRIWKLIKEVDNR